MKKKNGKVFFNTAFTKSYGLKQFAELTKLNAKPDDEITFQAGFYLPKEEALKLKTFRDDPYDNRYRIGKKGIIYVPLFHAKYYIICPYKSIYDFLQTYCQSNKTFFNAKQNEKAYDAFWNDLVNRSSLATDRGDVIDERKFQSVKDHLTINFSNFVKNKQADPLHYSSAVAREDIWFNSRDLINNEKKHGICKFNYDDTYSTYPKNGCLFVVLYYYYHDAMERISKGEPGRLQYSNFCISRIYKIIYGKDAEVPSPDDGDAWGLSFDQIKNFLKYFQIPGGLFDGFYSDLKCYYDPSEDGYAVSKELSGFYYVYANNHAWPIDKKLIRQLSHTTLKKARDKIAQSLDFVQEKLQRDIKRNYETDFTNFRFDITKKKKEQYKLDNVFVLLDSFDEIYQYIHSQSKQNNYIILTNLDLKDDIFIPFLDKQVIPSVYIKYQRIESLTLRLFDGKSTFLIKNQFSDSAGLTIIQSVDEYKLYMSHFEKIKHSLISPKFHSTYSPQVLDIFHTYKVGGIRCIFDYDNYEEPIKMIDIDDNEQEVALDDDFMYGVSDFNRCFLSEFIKLKYLPVLNFDDNFIDYDGSPIEDYTLYVVQKTNDTFQYPFYHDSLSYGINLKRVDSNRFIIQKMLRPNQLIENTFSDLFEKVYQENKLSNSFKKDIANIIFGFLSQKFQNKHTSYFSTDIEEIRYFQKAVGGHSFSLENERGHFFYKKFSSPLNTGFYPIGILLLDSVHAQMDKLVDDLKQCDLAPFAMNVDCVYHEANEQKYTMFKNKFPHYFNYHDKNDWSAVGKIKYEEKNVNFSKEYVPKKFNFNFKMIDINVIDLKHESLWNQNDTFIDEVSSYIQKYRKLFFFGFAGMGKSTTAILACLKLGFSFLILTKTTKLSDKWIYDSYTSQTADSFFGFTRIELLPYSSMHRDALNKADVVIFDDIFLYDLKIIHQIFFLMQKYPDKIYIGNGDPLQLNSALASMNVFDGNKYDKLVDLASHLFGNICYLKINKRLNNEEDKIKFYNMIELFKTKNTDGIHHWIMENCNIVKKSQLLSLKNTIRTVITATNPQRQKYNNFIFSSVYGNDDWFSVGHIIMFDKPSIKYNEYKFGKSQKFKILEIDHDKKYTLQNIYTNAIVFIDDQWLRKNFDYPFSTTCHSWQGDTCKDKLLIDGWSRNWVDLEWKFSAITRTDNFKNVYIVLDDDQHRLDNDLKLHDKLESLMMQDIDRFGKSAINFSRFIDVEWMKYKLHEALMEKKVCIGCDGFLNSWDRIDSSLPHYKSNTQLVCFDCNRNKGSKW